MKSDIANLTKKENSNLYDRDYYLWIEKMVELLHKKNFDAIDLVNLIEEIENMGRSEKKSVTSNLRILLMHLLKYKFQPEKRSNNWLFTIREHRKRLQESFKLSPSLKRYYEEVFLECYRDARELAGDETGLSIDTFPQNPAFTSEEALNTEYLPKD
jgi:hypothetical protein